MMYAAGGCTPHVYCRFALDDGVVDCGSYVQWHTSTSTSSSTRSSHVANDSAVEERYIRQDKMMQNLTHSQQHILEIMQLRVLYMLNLSTSI
jgi:hypothetical protein